MTVAVKPDVAAAALIEWVETFDMAKTSQFWAVRGPVYVIWSSSLGSLTDNSLGTLRLQQQ